MYRLLAFAKYDERYVIPAARHTERARELDELACSLDYEGGPRHVRRGPLRGGVGQAGAVAVENFHALRHRQTTDAVVDPEQKSRRVNLLNWDGKGVPDGLFPEPSARSPGTEERHERSTRDDARSLTQPHRRHARCSSATPTTRRRRCCRLCRPSSRACPDDTRTRSPPSSTTGGSRGRRCAEHYVAVFDMKRRCCPYLTYWTHGDTRNRGAALVRFKQVYRASGAVPRDDELPDHLPSSSTSRPRWTLRPATTCSRSTARGSS